VCVCVLCVYVCIRIRVTLRYTATSVRAREREFVPERQISFAKEPCKRDDILQKRPIIL